MDPIRHQNGSASPRKVFVQRDYSQGTNIRFQTKFPQELDGMISTQIFTGFIETLNQMYHEAEAMNGRTCCESCLACITAYITYLCIETYFDKCLKKIAAYIQEQNDINFKPRGLYVVNPIERGLRVIEIIITSDHPRAQNS